LPTDPIGSPEQAVQAAAALPVGGGQLAGVSVSRQRPNGKEENIWPGQISAVDLMGDRVRVRIDGTPGITAEVAPSAVDELQLDDGGELWATVQPSAIKVYPP
jgi:molybdate transport system ATP-binding protein